MIAIAFLLAAASANPAYTERCTAISVYDGDGPIHCREGWKIRLDGIAAREMDGTCRPGHPCPSASAEAARDSLVRLLGGPTGRLSTGHITIRPVVIRCAVTGKSYDRRTAWCQLPDSRDISCAMVSSGTALRWPKYWRGHRCP
ncbi:MAG: thermonuclease family protein [Sphingopyxis sp.]